MPRAPLLESFLGIFLILFPGTCFFLSENYLVNRLPLMIFYTAFKHYAPPHSKHVSWYSKGASWYAIIAIIRPRIGAPEALRFVASTNASAHDLGYW